MSGFGDKEDPMLRLYRGYSGTPAHPDSPAGGGGPGYFRETGPLGLAGTSMSGLPHPDSPAGRRLTPTDIDKAFAKIASPLVSSSDAKKAKVHSRQQVRVAENEEYLKNQNVKAMLDMIAKSEGGDYHAKFGWHPGSSKWTFTDESTHPGPGVGGKTTASGRYQINRACWMEHGTKAQGLSDFTPHTQDLIVVDNIRAHNSLQAVIDGDLKAAIDNLKANQWTSFQVHSYSELESWYKSAGGSVK